MGEFFYNFPRFNRNTIMILLATALIGLTFEGGIYAVLFNLYLLRLDYGPEFVGQVNSAGLLAFALSSLPAGLIGSHWGCRNALLNGLGLVMLGMGLLPLAELCPPMWRSAWLFGGLIIMYIGLALFFVNAAPLLMANSRPEQRNDVIAA